MQTGVRRGQDKLRWQTATVGGVQKVPAGDWQAAGLVHASGCSVVLSLHTERCFIIFINV